MYTDMSYRYIETSSEIQGVYIYEKELGVPSRHWGRTSICIVFWTSESLAERSLALWDSWPCCCVPSTYCSGFKNLNDWSCHIDYCLGDAIKVYCLEGA